ncbi:hypothetical protein NDS46_14040 [Paenibacillus thiaminolyticus]|uniref:hypothetical protein n=1 Tax=Paenibacillus thiaminolyticus TaxID=49283 RepID=UPI00232AEB13|nr:hypothetical protein [Paenibacillus thiaminolyticus]WCF10891.1 hypothetical protein NDS46_14040 [Paenibacillus thiaminolyticus]
MTTEAEPAAVLITGARAPAALEWARLLHAADCRVYVCDSLPAYVSRYSRAAAGAFTVPAPRFGAEAFADAVAEAVAKHRVGLVVPTCEEIFYLACYRERLEEAGAALFADRLPALLRLHHKLDFIRTAASHGFRVPDSRLIGTPADLKEALSAWTDRERVVLKPVYSRFASQVQIGSPRPGRGHIQAPANLSPGNPWVLQQYIEGAPLCTYSIVRHGRVVAHAAYEARYRAGLGAAVQFAALDHPGALRWVRRFAEAERLTGQIAFDFIEAVDGRLFPIECNPRATSGIHLFAPEDGIAEAVLRHGEPEREQALIAPPGGRQAMIGFAMAACLLRRGLRWTERREALRALCRSRDVLFRARDPWPVLGQVPAMFALLRLGREHGVPLMEASTIDLEWNGDAT